MTIPEQVIHIVSEILGKSPAVHQVDLVEGLTDTNCLAWPLDHKTFPLANDLLDELKQQLASYDVFVYKSGLAWHDVTMLEATFIVIAPFRDQFEVLRLEDTAGPNWDVLTDDIIRQFTSLDEKYGLDITAASYDIVEFRLGTMPEGTELEEFNDWLVEFCPSVFEPPSDYPGGRIALWWD